MKILEKSTQTKELIIDASTKLFYENGIENTYLEDIARLCGITKPLISHYYGSKSNLAKEVTKKYYSKIKNNVTEKIYNTTSPYNLQYSTFVELMMISRLYNEDQNAVRFFCEYLDLGFGIQFSEDTMNYYKIHDRKYHLNIDKNSHEIELLSTASMFSIFSLTYAFFTGKLHCNFNQFCDYTARIPFNFMNIDEEKIDEIIAGGKELLEKLDFKVLPYFIIE